MGHVHMNVLLLQNVDDRHKACVLQLAATETIRASCAFREISLFGVALEKQVVQVLNLGIVQQVFWHN
jgi:hypothetical protein